MTRLCLVCRDDRPAKQRHCPCCGSTQATKPFTTTEIVAILKRHGFHDTTQEIA